ncbi:N-acetylneuraminate synthase [Salinimicrobium sp. HB62]|uniref:N-acetylneuraminate synthase n=1 Tax=Salinimicrobium sp. HB62 TaxID=3077781 RepID=UPI002D77BDF8|nr:N-acetylneuraminate synthase [Salinimicrobium sp. HB62]
MEKVIIIAEAGVNHNGDMEKAKQLIDAAKEAGADYVKFQTFKTELSVSKSAKKANYQIENSRDKAESQFDMLKKLELSEETHLELIRYCEQKGIKFFSTGFDADSLLFLKSLGLEVAKVPSGELVNLPYLRMVAKNFPQIILSTGMGNMEEVKAAYNVLMENGTEHNNITILHCNTEYPTPMEDVNLKAMNAIGEELGVKVGYSDHTLGIEVPIAAVALGATVIEKHFTLDRNLPGPDHRASLEPAELKAMVSAIRNIEKAVSGSGYKEPSPSEKKNRAIVRKSIVAAKEIKKGEILTEKNITIKRPGGGISPMKWDEVVGKRAERDYNTDDQI